MKIKFNSDDNLPLDKTSTLHKMTKKMLESNRIDISEGIDINKTNAS